MSGVFIERTSVYLDDGRVQQRTVGRVRKIDYCFNDLGALAPGFLRKSMTLQRDVLRGMVDFAIVDEERPAGGPAADEPVVVGPA